MPHTPLRELKPELFLDEYQTDSEDDGFNDSDEEEDGELFLTVHSQEVWLKFTINFNGRISKSLVCTRNENEK